MATTVAERLKNLVDGKVKGGAASTVHMDELLEKHATKIAEKQLATEVKAAEKAAKRAASKMMNPGVRGFFSKNIKRAGIGAGIVAGVVGLGVLASSWRNSRAKDSREELANANAPAMDAIPQVMTADQPMMIGGVPAVEGAHVARVRAGRGMSPVAVNPNITAVDGPVADLGSPVTR